MFSGVAIGDLNRDGRLEVVVGGDSSTSQFYWQGGRINCLSWQGKREWVVQTDQVIWSTPALADLQGNGYLDVVVGTGLEVKNGDSESGNESMRLIPTATFFPVGRLSPVPMGPPRATAPVPDFAGRGRPA